MSDNYDDSTPQSNSTPSTPPPGVNRAQSMRMPKSASPTSPTAPPIGYQTMGRASAGRVLASVNATGQPPPPPRIMVSQYLLQFKFLFRIILIRKLS